MSALSDALLFLDLDKGKDPVLEEQRGALTSDPRLRPGWLRYQALQALALETAPAPSEKMLRAVMTQCRRDGVRQHLSAITGGDELAREILLGKGPKSRGKAAWILGLLLLGALGLGWVVFQDGRPGLGLAMRGPEAATAPFLSGPSGTVPFEFPVQTPPAEAALAGPVDDASASDADDVHDEPPAARQASRLLSDHLHEAEAREQGSDADTDAPAFAPAPAATMKPAPTATPRPAPTPVPALQAGLTLSSDTLLASASSGAAGLTPSAAGQDQNGPLDITVDMPSRHEIDVRLFTLTGKPARILASGAFGPGAVHLLLDAKDDTGTALAPGTYYLRVMTPWFSRVEPIQIH
jgi:hypothetical protein